VTCAVYACEHGLLEEEGWKRFKGIAKREKKMLRMVNQSHIKATRNAPRYKFGYRIPHNYSEAMKFDLKNGNTLWREATDLEMSQLAELPSSSNKLMAPRSNLTSRRLYSWIASPLWI
jgi:hypothetical protein